MICLEEVSWSPWPSYPGGQEQPAGSPDQPRGLQGHHQVDEQDPGHGQGTMCRTMGQICSACWYLEGVQ